MVGNTYRERKLSNASEDVNIYFFKGLPCGWEMQEYYL